jgi:antitoxin ParD1/3/4
MPTRNINLTEHFDRFVKRQVSSGRDSNASEMVRDALRLLEEQEQEREAKLQALRQAAEQGFAEIDQGQGIVLKSEKALGQFFADIEAEVAANSLAFNERRGGSRCSTSCAITSLPSRKRVAASPRLSTAVS